MQPAMFDLDKSGRSPFSALVQIPFSPQPSAAIKVKDGSYDFYQENSKHSLAKIRLQAIKRWEFNSLTLYCSLCQHGTESLVQKEKYMTRKKHKIFNHTNIEASRK